MIKYEDVIVENINKIIKEKSMKCRLCNMSLEEYRGSLMCINCNNIQDKPHE